MTHLCNGNACLFECACFASIALTSRAPISRTHLRPPKPLRPEGYTESSGGGASATGPWQKFYDEESASYFYFNNLTQESVFERPEEYLSPRPDAFEAAAAAPRMAATEARRR